MFLTSRKLRFSLGNMPPAPYFIVHQKAILPHQNAKFTYHHINKPTKNNMAVLKWYTSNAVNILHVCYFLELPKFLLRLLVFCFFFTTSAYTGQCLFSAYGKSKRVPVIFHFFFIFSPSLSSFFLFLFFGGGGRGGAGRLSQLIGIQGCQPQIISN